MKKRYYFLIILIFMLPTIVGYLTNTDMHFTGLGYPTDANNYFSIMNQAKEGNLLFNNLYTYEDIPALNIRPTFMVAGWFAAIVGSNALWYHLFRIIGIVFFVYFLDKLIALITDDKKQRNMTIFICIFASGIGFLFKFLTLFGVKQYGSIDLWIASSNNFLILISHAHTIFSIGLMIASIYYLLKWNKESKLKPLVIASIFAFVLGFEHLFDVITIYLALGFFMLDQFVVNKKIDWKKIKQLLLFGFITAIPFIYTYLMFMHPAYANWNAQNALDTPKFLHVIFGYGIMFASFVGFLLYSFLNKNYNKLKPAVKFSLYWIVAVLILIYSPFNIQRRFFEGVHIPFGIITGLFLFTILKPHLLKKYSMNVVGVLILLIIFLTLPTNVLHLFTHTTELDNDRGNLPYMTSRYIYPEEHNALLWLSENSEKEAVIISTYNIGNHIVGYMNRRVYLGHWAQTMNLEEKTNNIEDYFLDIKDISLDKVTYVWYGVDEMELNPDFKQPLNSEIVFTNEKVIIFKLK